MKIKNLFLLLVIGGSFILSNTIFSSCASKNKMNSSLEPQLPSLVGIWQLCYKLPSKADGTPQYYMGKTIKTLLADGTFTNIYFNDQQGRTTITGHGTFIQTSDSTYTESLISSMHKYLNNTDNALKFEIINDKILHIKFYREKNNDGTPLNKWFDEYYVKVKPIGKGIYNTNSIDQFD